MQVVIKGISDIIRSSLLMKYTGFENTKVVVRNRKS